MSMRIRVGRSSTMNAKGGKILGIFLILFGLTFSLSSISMSCRATMFKKMLPGNVQEYDAYITEVLSVESDVVWKEDSDGDSDRTTVYDSKVVLEYEIEGQTYTASYTFKERNKACKIGDKYRLSIDPENPTKIYGYSTGEGGVVLMVVEIVFGLIGGAVVVAGIVLIVKDKKRAKAEKEQATQINQGSSDYLGYSGQNYVGNEYSGHGFDASASQGTNYSGTSLRD